MEIRAIDAGHHSDQGPFRKRNEDMALTNLADGVFVVADGLGGAAAGDRAARVASEVLASVLRLMVSPQAMLERVLPDDDTRETLAKTLPSEEDLKDCGARVRFAFHLAHWGVLAEARGSGSIGMASAAVVGCLRQGVLTVGHVGDCRAYTLEGKTLTLLTRDHSLSRALEGRYSLPRGAEASAFLRSRLTQVVGGECAPTPDVRRLQATQGAKLLLCTDGVWGSLPDEELTRLLAVDEPAQESARRLVEAAIAAGSRDNSTALVVLFGA